MNKYKKILGFAIAVALVLMILPSGVLAQSPNYDSNDMSKLELFLNSASGIPGKTNGQCINPSYDQNVPSTWTGVKWTESTPKRVVTIGRAGQWNNASLAGSLDLSDFSELEYVSLDHNLITSLNTQNDIFLFNVYCTNNRLTDVLFEVETGYVHLKANGNGYVGFEAAPTSDGEYIQVRAFPQAMRGYEFENWGNYSEMTNKDDNSITLNTYQTLHDCTAYFIPGEGPWPSITPSPSLTPSPSPSATPTAEPYKFTFYEVNFDLNGGTWTGGGLLSQTIEKNEDAEPPVATWKGYHLIGWDGSYQNIQKNVTLKAIWEAYDIMNKVTFDLNAGIQTGGGDLVQTVEDGNAATAPEVERYGYTFVKWHIPFDKVMEDITVAAIWERNAAPQEEIKYRVIYDISGGEGTAPVDTNEYLKGDTAVMADGTELIKEGSQFVGWSYEIDGDVIDEEEILVEKDVTLYAVWENADLAEPTAEPTQAPAEEVPAEDEVADIPKTGDVSGVYPAFLMLAFGAAIVTFELIKRNRYRKLKE